MAKNIISNETIKRLLKDVKEIFKNPLTDNNIYYTHDDDDMTKGYAMIVGPENTPYFGGYYFFEFNFPYDYPFSPPYVVYMTNDGKTRFNPNLYKCGKVCISILNTWPGEKWSACQTIRSILLTLCSLLNNSPLENEPGIPKTHNSIEPYNRSIEYTNIQFTICKLINDIKYIQNPKFEYFYPFMLTHFINNYDKLINFVKSKDPKIESLYVPIYSMKTTLDYKSLENLLVETKQIIT